MILWHLGLAVTQTLHAHCSEMYEHRQPRGNCCTIFSIQDLLQFIDLALLSGLHPVSHLVLKLSSLEIWW